MNTRLAPFDDVRVRKAMQMALDVKTINQTFFKGYGITTPGGRAGTPGYIVPFEEWPEEIKKGYIYDPEGAEALLDAAGLTRGADGIRFTTQMHVVTAEHEIGWFEALYPYFNAIGVEVETVVWATEGEWMVNTFFIRPPDKRGPKDGTYANMIPSVSRAYDRDPAPVLLYSHSSSRWNEAVVNDPVYDAMVEAYQASTTLKERQRTAREAMMYAAEQHWFLWGAKIPRFSAAAPWIIGYSGELGRHEIAARLWIDSELKKTMGR
jgi:ABC-type transport system substrate-binding protein